MTAELPDPASYGRIVRDISGQVVKIVEKKDATSGELLIKEINTGTYCFNSRELFTALNEVRPDNAQKEYYLTDVIGILKRKGLAVLAYKAGDPNEVLGVNTIEEIGNIEGIFKNAS